MTPSEKLKLKNSVMRTLHAPGGPYAPGAHLTAVYPGEGRGESAAGNILEMTIVFDCTLSREQARAYGTEIIGTLKNADEIFRKTRLNAIRWISDDKIRHDVTAAPMLQMGGYFVDYEQHPAQKRLEILMENLKKFEARSRLVILVSDGAWEIGDPKRLKENLNPFLYRRLVLVEPGAIRDGAGLLKQ